MEQTITNLVNYHACKPDALIYEPFEDKRMPAGEYIQSFPKGKKINPVVLPLDVLGVYRLEMGRGGVQVQVVFGNEIDVKAVSQALSENSELSDFTMHNGYLRFGKTSLIFVGKQHMAITVGTTSPLFQRAVRALEALYNSGVFQSEDSPLANDAVVKPRLEMRQTLDQVLEARLEAIQTVEGQLRTEQRMELKQVMAMRLAPLLRMEYSQVQELSLDAEQAIQDARQLEKTIMGRLARRLMNELPPDKRPATFKEAISMAYKVVRRSTSGGQGRKLAGATG